MGAWQIMKPIGWAVVWFAWFAISAGGVFAPDPPLPDPLPSLPIRSLEEAKDDPLMRAIQERVQSIQGPQDAGRLQRKRPKSVPTKSAQSLRWHVAERMLRTARRLEKDARFAEADGQTELAEALYRIIDRTRSDALQLLTPSHPPAP